jgi:hypothetical protein
MKIKQKTHLRNKTMFRLAVLILLFVTQTFAQQKQQKPTVELFKRYDYKIEISETNGFSGYSVKYILDNSSLNDFNAIEDSNYILKPYVFYMVNYNPEPFTSANRVDTTQMPFSKKMCDSLFELTRKCIRNLPLKNVERIANGAITKKVVSDDSEAIISLNYAGVYVLVSIESVSNTEASTKETMDLLKFIWKLTTKTKN